MVPAGTPNQLKRGFTTPLKSVYNKSRNGDRMTVVDRIDLTYLLLKKYCEKISNSKAWELSMIYEWIRIHYPSFSSYYRYYIATDKDIELGLTLREIGHINSFRRGVEND